MRNPVLTDSPLQGRFSQTVLQYKIVGKPGEGIIDVQGAFTRVIHRTRANFRRLLIYLWKRLIHVQILLRTGELVVLISLVTYALPVQNTPPHFEFLTVHEGLSNNRVNAICQDSRGFMWFGTEGGLNRFDGYNFVAYGHMPFWTGSTIYEDHNGLLWLIAEGGILYRFDRASEKFVRYPILGKPSNRVFEDSFGDIWVATWGNGLGRYLRDSDSFRMYTHHAGQAGALPDNNISIVYEDKERRLWVGSDSGLIEYERNKDAFLRLERGPGNCISSIVEDRKGLLWLATNNGLWECDQSRTSFEHHVNTGHEWNNIFFVYDDSRDDLWIGSGGGISRFDRPARRFVNFDKYLPGTGPTGITWPTQPIYEDRGGTLWSGVSSTLARFNREKQDFEICSYDPSKPKAGDDAVTSAIYEDRSGRIWFGTMRRGVQWFERSRKPFFDVHLVNVSPSVISIYRDEAGVLWLGKPDGLCRVNLETMSQVHHVHEDNNPHSLSGNTISQIVEESPGTLWLGTFERGLNRFDKATGRCTRYTHNDSDPRSLFNDNIGALLIDRTGVLWVGTEGGDLERFDRQSATFTHFKIDSIGSEYVQALCEDRSGSLWIGGTNGMLRFDKSSAHTEHYFSDPDVRTSLSNNNVSAIYEDSQGTLWIGTDYGLNRFEKTNGSFSHITESEGLASDKIIGILEDRHGSLWLLTPKGISTYAPATGRVRNFDEHDGVGLDAALYFPYFRDKTGEMFFGGFSDLIRFDPDSILDNPVPPPVVLTSFKIFEKPVRLDSAIAEKKALELSYRDNVITFEYSALNYTAAEKNQYAYKLEGFDKDWIYSGTKRSATYTNLDGGSYVFRVKGSNNDGIWNEEGTSIAVFITPPPWKAPWAYFMYLVCAAVALYSIRRYQINKMKSRHQLEMVRMEADALKEVDTMKSRFFANISHEFRTPLTLILGPVESMLAAARDEKSRQDIGMIQRNARRLLSLVNQLLDLSRIEAHRMKLSVREMDIVELVRGVAASFESLAARKSIQLSVTWSEPIAGYFDSDVVEKILTNLLSNALKFTREGGQVSVTVQRLIPPSTVGRQVASANGEDATIAVSDTGVGISSDQREKIFDRFYQVDATQTREHEGTGIGLALTRELVQLHKGHISVSSEPGRGSTFTIRLPLGKEHLTPDEITAAPAQPASAKSAVTHVQGEPADSTEPVEDVDDESSDQKRVVLVIEDNNDMRRYISDRLKVLYAVIEAENGAVGLKEATTSVPDLIVSDVMMPKLDGMELCRRLKDDVRTSHIPIILLTAKAGTDHRIEGFQTGADDYLVKPFDADELAARIANLIEQRRLLRERFRHEIVLKPRDITVTPVDEQFLNRVMTIVEEHMADSDLDTDAMARELFLSRMQLHRKLKALTGQSPHDFLRAMRLQRASELLRHRAGNVSEIAYEVGFNNLSHFAKSFREQFGKSPSEFVEDLPDPDR
jgi:signal transduction histidine kinase/ligand-binding sensor domain-containing protein/DNA-binding response OmpR family regulator